MLYSISIHTPLFNCTFPSSTSSLCSTMRTVSFRFFPLQMMVSPRKRPRASSVAVLSVATVLNHPSTQYPACMLTPIQGRAIAATLRPPELSSPVASSTMSLLGLSSDAVQYTIYQYAIHHRRCPPLWLGRSRSLAQLQLTSSSAGESQSPSRR